MSLLNKRHFTSEKYAFKYLESIIWPEGPVCPKCGSCTKPYDLGKTRVGLKKCRDCKKQFTVKVGTVFESSHIPLHKWMQAVYLICSSKKGISAHQLHRTLEITYKTAWFMCHRIRVAMEEGTLPPIGGEGQIVQADETYFGKKANPPTVKTSGQPFIKSGKAAAKLAVITLVSGGKSRTFHVDRADAAIVRQILKDNVKPETELHTDESRLYTKVGKEFAKHETVKHTAGEYYRDGVHTNKCENYFSIFKRGMRGVYQHCSEKHLQRYLSEFDFRYNNRESDDALRTEKALAGIVGKRIMYRDSSMV
ncbi:MAG: IS1595 family transposase [Alphaproteobacteria bacterium]|nr:IS1595 family transposase [Alphaproteobacteria bacterium]